MPSPGTLKSLSTAINTHISTLATPLPEDLNEVVESYLQKHEKHDDANSEKLQDELLSIHSKHVAGHPELLSGFIALLSQLLPAIRSPSRIFQWWDLLQAGVGEALLTEKGLASDISCAISNLLSQDDVPSSEEGGAPAFNPFVKRLVSIWMEHFRGPSLGGRADLIEKLALEALTSYGKTKPKDFLTILDSFFVKAEFRMGTATLLCEFIQTQPPHLYQVLDTPLFSNLLRCLQLDSSTTAVSLTLTALTMLMPHSPSAMVPHLPTLFNIYARLLFWHVQHSEDTDVPYEQVYLGDPTGWEACPYSRDLDGPDIPSLRNYFTILYGLYPINFMDYIRKPHRYLRHANDPSAGVVEIQPSEIRHKSEEFRRGHLLHPNFYHLTIESEKTDHGRWQASEPAEVVAECAALCIMEDQPRLELIEEPPQTRRKSSMLSGDESNSSLRDFPLLRVVSTDGGRRAGDLANKDSTDSYSQSPNENESPTVTSQLAVSPSETQLQELLHSNKLIKSGLQQSLSNDSVPSLSLNHQESITGLQHAPRARAESSVSTADAQSKLSQLRGQILLLQNDLSFERYLKQQHIAHMGELRRRQVKEAASEAEMQNLIIANRNLKSRFEEAKKAEMQVKRESEKSRSLAKKWEADLSTKLKTLREEAKKTKAERDDLKRELEISQTECDELKSRLCGFEVRELNWEQNAQSHEIDKSEMDRLKSELARLTATERYFQGKEDQMKQALETAASVEAQIPALDAKLAAQEEDHQRAREAYEEQIAALKSKIVAREQDENSERLSASANRAIESALAASRARQAELKKQYDLLSRKYTALQSSLFDMQCDSSPESGPGKPDASVPGGSDGLHGQAVPVSSSPAQARAGIQRVATSPEVIEHTSAKSATTSSIARPGALAEPSESSTSIPTIASGSEPRFLGRGGAGNRARKEGKEGKEGKDGKDGKEKKEGDKKDKKIAALRGIKNFHIV